MARFLAVLIGAAALVPMPAVAACQVAKMVELPITMAGRQPMVAAQFAGKDARFIVDSGAFYSTISRASAAEFGLRVTPAPPSFRVIGIGGDTSAGVAETRDFTIAGIKLPRVDFLVGGTDMGSAGLIGQNILGLADVEYDLPHGAVRLMKTTGCGGATLAYWAGDKPFTIVPLERAPDGPFKPHTVGTVLINGVKVRAVFDSGASSSLLSLAAARRAGVTPQSPGVVSAGAGRGLGTHEVAAWLAPFDSIDIGGEAIAHPKIRIADVSFGDGEMLIGIDFFLTHRVFVSNANHKVYITYEGGPLFGLSPKGARTAEGKALDLTDKAAEPTTAEGYSQRGAVLASNHRLDEALAAFDKACALAPKEGRYFYQRALAHLANGQHYQGLADLDRTIAFSPDFAEPRLTRAQFRLRGNDRSGALEDVKAADRVLAPSADRRFAVAAYYDQLDLPEAALANYDLWLNSHIEDASRPSALNGRCWARALLGRELDKALSDCNAAIRAQPHNAAYLDSRGLVRLRRGELPQALTDYDAALALSPRNAWTLYARSIAETKAGKTAQAGTDRTAALAIDSHAGDRARKIGLE